MTQDTFLGYLRSAMAIVGSLFVGHAIINTPITSDILDSIIGGSLGVASTVWGIVDKTATLEMVTSALAKVITFAGGIAVTMGVLQAGTLVAIMGAIPLLASEIMKRVANKKDQNIASGKMGVSDLKAAVNVQNKGEVIAPVVLTPTK